MSTTRQTLPHDYCRCLLGCPEHRDACLRYLAREDMGERTPWAERFCPDTGTTAEGFILARDVKVPA